MLESTARQDTGWTPVMIPLVQGCNMLDVRFHALVRVYIESNATKEDRTR